MPEAAPTLQPADELDVLEQRQRRKPVHRYKHRTTHEYALVAVRQIEPSDPRGNGALDDPGLPGAGGQGEAKASAHDVGTCFAEALECSQPAIGKNAVRVEEPEPLPLRACCTRIELKAATWRPAEQGHIGTGAANGREAAGVAGGRNDDPDVAGRGQLLQ